MTAFRSQTDGQLAQRHDPKPMLGSTTGRRYAVPYSAGVTGEAAFHAPRVECIPSRDPKPWKCSIMGEKIRTSVQCLACQWKPRRRFARPQVNWLLAAFREDMAERADGRPFSDGTVGTVGTLAQRWLDTITSGWPPAEIDHARRVLTRLAALRNIGTKGGI